MIICPFNVGRSNPAFIFVQNKKISKSLWVTQVRRGYDSADLDRLKNHSHTVAVWHVTYYGNAKRHNK